MIVPGEMQPRAGGQAEVSASIDGRIVEAAAVPIGQTVERGQVLARIAPPTSVPADRPALELAKAEAENCSSIRRNATASACRDWWMREQCRRRRLDEARLNESTQQARLSAAEARTGAIRSHKGSGAVTLPGLSPFGRRFLVPLSNPRRSPARMRALATRCSGSLDAGTVYVAANVSRRLKCRGCGR